jgi:WhiB family redox-sensing transcriptional regulator
MSERDWRRKAACAGMDPGLFFPIGSSGLAAEQTERAKAVCAGCQVRVKCLEWALATGQHDGVWGGLSEDERRKLRRRR